MKKSFFISTKQFNGTIELENNLIIKASSGLNRFVGEEVTNLFDYLDDRFPDYKVEPVNK